MEMKRLKEIEHRHIDDPLVGLTSVEVNPTELCNRTCAFCPRSDPEVYPNQNLHMTRQTIISLVDNLVKHNYKGRIVFSGMGEPTLNKDILAHIKIASDKLSDVQMYTNGDKVLNDEWYTLDDFIDAGLTSLFIDVYDDAEQMRKWINKVEKYKNVIPIHLSAKYEFPIEIFTNRAGTVKTQGVPQRVNNTPCFIPHTKAFVDWDGSLLLCCNDWAREAGKFGNVNDTPFHQLWRSEPLNAIRRKLMTQSRVHGGTPCDKCNATGNQKLKHEVHAVWKPVLF